VDATTAPDRGVVARFDDGTQATGDLLIGADGVHSATRRIIDPTAPTGRYVGLVNFGGYTRQAAHGAQPGIWHMIFGRRAFFGYVVDPAGGTVWFANVPPAQVSRAERAATTAAQWRRQLIDLFADDHGPAVKLITAGQLELAADNTYDLPSVATWHKGPMIIVGDAAHAPAPTSGQGASMAAEDAVVLAKCLRDLPDIPRAFAAYEQLRRQRVERIVAQGPAGAATRSPAPSPGSCATSPCRSCSRFSSPRSPSHGCTTTTSTGTPRHPRPPRQPWRERPWRASGTHPTRSRVCQANGVTGGDRATSCRR
jgi:2-polyprenyl-6-methoxyphenol hydroxylase-like FAD-dependent oxidoreductase